MYKRVVDFLFLSAFLPSTFAMYMVLLSYGGWFAGNNAVIFHSLIFGSAYQLMKAKDTPINTTSIIFSPDLHFLSWCYITDSKNIHSLLAQSHQAILFVGLFAFKQMDIQFTEAWYSPKSKQLVLFLYKEPPKPYCIMGLCK